MQSVVLGKRKATDIHYYSEQICYTSYKYSDLSLQ